MSGITYWQGSLKLADCVGLCNEAASLPQDEATAAVVIAAILARHFAPAHWPGWYVAHVDALDKTVTVAEDDERVRLARLLLERRGRPELTALVLADVRGRVRASMLGEQAGLAVAQRD